MRLKLVLKRKKALIINKVSMYKLTSVVIKRFVFLSCTLVLGVSLTSKAAQLPVTKQTAKGPAKRIIALAPHIVESLFAIGAGKLIVGTVAYSDFPEQALEIPRIGGYHGIQIEKILEMRPDLVIVWRNGNKVADIEQLKRLGLTLAYSEPNNIEGVADELRYLGKLTGHEKKAEQLAEQYTENLEAIRQMYKGKSPISVFYQLWSEPLMSVNKNTWIHQLLETCGAKNVFSDNSTSYPQLSIENVIVAKPQLIIMPQENSEKPQPKINWRQWEMIPAVKNNLFMEVDADLIHRFSRRMLLGLEDMCQKIDLSRQKIINK